MTGYIFKPPVRKRDEMVPFFEDAEQKERCHMVQTPMEMEAHQTYLVSDLISHDYVDDDLDSFKRRWLRGFYSYFSEDTELFPEPWGPNGPNSNSSNCSSSCNFTAIEEHINRIRPSWSYYNKTIFDDSYLSAVEQHGQSAEHIVASLFFVTSALLALNSVKKFCSFRIPVQSFLKLGFARRGNEIHM
eukprot:gnl/MRDRNA2_/MRDRNA2_366214_c0_seq1.p1 gnl/MRDRNA2_/MRDRNA2_366214_c0~~gnl/MRDRNA2_/MRDRNA2_366214_c0_seq1.p1  ORF type:complete len:212 (+),score=26.39 gnl/MRDRNA2_/MRDRNA2_366214_c0_seq1:74-637(+)